MDKILDYLINSFKVDNHTIFIPSEKFDPDWDQQLLDEGFEAHGFGDFVVVPIPKNYKPLKLEKKSKPPKKQQIKKKKSNIGGDMAGRKRWSEEADKLLISICEKNPALKMNETHKEYCRLKPIEWEDRSFRGIKSRISKLRAFGKIKHVYKVHRIIECPYCGGKFDDKK